MGIVLSIIVALLIWTIVVQPLLGVLFGVAGFIKDNRDFDKMKDECLAEMKAEDEELRKGKKS